MADTETATSPRIATIDAVRGFAVCGILLMNIVSMGMPGYAYIDPTYWGRPSAADIAVWAINYVLSDGKMRALFTMLFGASMLLIIERAAASPDGKGPAEIHYRRLFWLFLFGMIHAWFFWYGDILTSYAIAGAIAFPLWRWRTRSLLIAAALLLSLQAGLNLAHHAQLQSLRAAAEAPGATPRQKADWEKTIRASVPDQAAAAAEVRGYRGSFIDALNARVPLATLFQTTLLWLGLPELLGFVALGMALFRTGFFAGRWRRRTYLAMIGLGYLVAAPLMVPVAHRVMAADWDPVLLPVTDTIGLALRPFIALAHASVVILLVQSGAARWLTRRLEAAGRMAFSNYLGTTLVTTTIFYGYGLGLFATLSRAQLYLVVLFVWVLILGWSKPWLARFEYGPLEWLWRRLARGEPVPFRRQAAIAS
jgi:uncharacterized protein